MHSEVAWRDHRCRFQIVRMTVTRGCETKSREGLAGVIAKVANEVAGGLPSLSRTVTASMARNNGAETQQSSEPWDE